MRGHKKCRERIFMTKNIIIAYNIKFSNKKNNMRIYKIFSPVRDTE